MHTVHSCNVIVSLCRMTLLVTWTLPSMWLRSSWTSLRCLMLKVKLWHNHCDLPLLQRHHMNELMTSTTAKNHAWRQMVQRWKALIEGWLLALKINDFGILLKCLWKHWWHWPSGYAFKDKHQIYSKFNCLYLKQHTHNPCSKLKRLCK